MHGARCNATSAETPVGSAIQISHATNTLGNVLQQIVSTDAVYLSMADGERVKIGWDSTLVWAIDYGDNGYSMALSPDYTFLIAGS